MTYYYKQYADFWSTRDELINKYWNDRDLITHSRWLAQKLKKYEFDSVYEVGLYCGRNLFYIREAFPDVSIGGCDVNKTALEYAKNVLPDATLEHIDALNMNTEEKWDIVFTHGVLMHIPPDGIQIVIDRCLDKANKYIIHMEREACDNIVLRGAEEFEPEIVSKEFRWAPDVAAMYRNKGCKVLYNKKRRVGRSKKLQSIVIVEK